MIILNKIIFAIYDLVCYNTITMVKKSILFDKMHRFKKSSLKRGSFFSDQHLLKNQISIDDISNQKSHEEEAAEKLGEASQEVAKQGSKKKKVMNAIFFLVNIVVVACILIFQLFNSKVTSFDEIINAGNFRWQYIFVILFAFALIMFLDTARVTTLLKQSSKRNRPFLCYKMNAIGKYYDAVTPMSTGGQPFQIYYLSSHGVDPGTAISIPIARYVIFQIAWLIISLFATIYSTTQFGETNLVSVASYIGFALNFVMIVGVWFLSVGRVGKILVVKCLKFLCKIKIIKSYEKVYDKVMDAVNGFQSTMKTYTKHIWKFLGLIASQMVHLLIQFSIPYFIYLMLGGIPDFNVYIITWVYAVLCDLASGFTPLPGGTGMAEVAFTMVLTPIFPEGTVFWGLLLWRFMNYYIYLIQGIFVIIYDKIWGTKKYAWQKRKWELEAESNKFKQEQLKKYNKKNKAGKIRL